MTSTNDEFQQRFESAIYQVMRTVEGRFLVNALLSRCGLMQSGFNPDPYISAFDQGQRNVAAHLYADIDRVCPQYIPTMIQEAKENTNDRGNANQRGRNAEHTGSTAGRNDEFGSFLYGEGEDAGQAGE